MVDGFGSSRQSQNQPCAPTKAIHSSRRPEGGQEGKGGHVGHLRVKVRAEVFDLLLLLGIFEDGQGGQDALSAVVGHLRKQVCVRSPHLSRPSP
jgi:hypothetical protein